MIRPYTLTEPFRHKIRQVKFKSVKLKQMKLSDGYKISNIFIQNLIQIFNQILIYNLFYICTIKNQCNRNLSFQSIVGVINILSLFNNIVTSKNYENRSKYEKQLHNPKYCESYQLNNICVELSKYISSQFSNFNQHYIKNSRKLTKKFKFYNANY